MGKNATQIMIILPHYMRAENTLKIFFQDQTINCLKCLIIFFKEKHQVAFRQSIRDSYLIRLRTLWIISLKSV